MAWTCPRGRCSTPPPGRTAGGSPMSRCTCRYPWAGVTSGAGQFVHGDMEKMPLDSSLFDVVISNGAFCLAPDKEAAFREVYRVLKPGGRLLILHPSSLHPPSSILYSPLSILYHPSSILNHLSSIPNIQLPGSRYAAPPSSSPWRQPSNGLSV